MTDRPVYRRVGVEMLLGHMIETGTFPNWEPGEIIVTTARDLYADRGTVEAVRRVLVGFGAIQPDDRTTDLAAMLEMLLPPAAT